MYALNPISSPNLVIFFGSPKREWHFNNVREPFPHAGLLVAVSKPRERLTWETLPRLRVELCILRSDCVVVSADRERCPEPHTPNRQLFFARNFDPHGSRLWIGIGVIWRRVSIILDSVRGMPDQPITMESPSLRCSCATFTHLSRLFSVSWLILSYPRGFK